MILIVMTLAVWFTMVILYHRKPLHGVYVSALLIIFAPKMLINVSAPDASFIYFFQTEEIALELKSALVLSFGDISMFACIVVWLFRIRYRASEVYLNPVSKAVFLFLAVFLFCETINFLRAESRLPEIKGTVLLLQKFLFFFFVIQNIRSRHDLINLLRLVMFAGVVVCLLGILEVTFAKSIYPEVYKYQRMASIFDGMPASFAAFLTMIFCILAQYAFQDDDQVVSGRVWMWITLSMVVFCLFRAFSRSGYFAMTVCLVLTFFTLPIKRRRLLIMLILVILLVGAIASPYLVENLVNSYSTTLTTDTSRWNQSLRARVNLWESLLDDVWNLLLLGGGFSRFDTLDNEWLYVLQLSGIIGLLAFFNMVIVGLIYAVRSSRRLQDSVLPLYAKGMAIAQVGVFMFSFASGFFLVGRPARVYWLLMGALVAISFVREDEQVELTEASI